MLRGKNQWYCSITRLQDKYLEIIHVGSQLTASGKGEKQIQKCTNDHSQSGKGGRDVWDGVSFQPPNMKNNQNSDVNKKAIILSSEKKKCALPVFWMFLMGEQKILKTQTSHCQVANFNNLGLSPLNLSKSNAIETFNNDD